MGTPLFTYLFIYLLFRATLAACGGSQARGLIRATAASLCHGHSHSHTRSKLHVQPTPQLLATPDSAKDCELCWEAIEELVRVLKQGSDFNRVAFLN